MTTLLDAIEAIKVAKDHADTASRAHTALEGEIDSLKYAAGEKKKSYIQSLVASRLGEPADVDAARRASHAAEEELVAALATLSALKDRAVTSIDALKAARKSADRVAAPIAAKLLTTYRAEIEATAHQLGELMVMANRLDVLSRPDSPGPMTGPGLAKSIGNVGEVLEQDHGIIIGRNYPSISADFHMRLEDLAALAQEK